MQWKTDRNSPKGDRKSEWNCSCNWSMPEGSAIFMGRLSWFCGRDDGRTPASKSQTNKSHHLCVNVCVKLHVIPPNTLPNSPVCSFEKPLTVWYTKHLPRSRRWKSLGLKSKVLFTKTGQLNVTLTVFNLRPKANKLNQDEQIKAIQAGHTIHTNYRELHTVIHNSDWKNRTTKSVTQQKLPSLKINKELRRS